MQRKQKCKNDWGDQCNPSLGLGCYCLDATYENVAYVFDTAASINDPGRYINHASKNYNLVKIGNQPNSSLKIGFMAKRDIKHGWNYGIEKRPRPSLDWDR